MSTAATRTQILDTAERLFASRGFAGTSLRRIIGEAGVNLAAVHYHFGSKDALFRAVLERHLDPLNQERLRLLDEAEARGTRRRDFLERTIEALVGPPLRLSRNRAAGGEHFMKLIGRTFAEADPKVQTMFLAMFEEIVRRFGAALRRACPHLRDASLFWRGHFMIGAMAHTMCDQETVRHFAADVCDVNDVERIIRELVAFMAAGLRGPDTSRPARKARKARS